VVAAQQVEGKVADRSQVIQPRLARTGQASSKADIQGPVQLVLDELVPPYGPTGLRCLHRPTAHVAMLLGAGLTRGLVLASTGHPSGCGQSGDADLV